MDSTRAVRVARAAPQLGDRGGTRPSSSMLGLAAKTAQLIESVGLKLLRMSLALVFLWFGALKVAGSTPVGELVAGTVPWVDAGFLVPALGVVEIAIGLGLMFGRTCRIVMPLFVAQMLGTFLVLVEEPTVAFQHGNPLLLTTVGEFVIKNVVLLTAGLVVGCRSQRADR